MIKIQKPKVKLTIYLIVLAVICFIAVGLLITGTRTKLPKDTNSKPKVQKSIVGKGQEALNHPLALAIARNGQIFVSDSGNNQVKVFESDGRFSFAFGQTGQHDGQFNNPYGIGFLPDGSLLVSDMLNYRVQRFDKKGKYLGLFLSAKEGIKPGMLLVDNYEIYISDLNSHQIVEFNQQGQILRRYSGEMNFPQGLAKIDSNLLVADAGNNSIKVFTGGNVNGGQVFGKAGSFQILRGLAVDNLKRVLVVDSMQSQIMFLSAKGDSLFSIGNSGSNQDQFMYPSGIAIDNYGKIYIADWGNNRIQVWGY